MTLQEKGLFANYIGPGMGPLTYLAKRFLAVLAKSGRVYIPVHLMMTLLKLRKKNRPGWFSLVKQFVIGVLKSSVFVSFFALSIPSMRVVPPVSMFFNNKLGSWGGYFVSFIFTWTIFLESKSRWPEVSMYVLA